MAPGRPPQPWPLLASVVGGKSGLNLQILCSFSMTSAPFVHFRKQVLCPLAGMFRLRLGRLGEVRKELGSRVSKVWVESTHGPQQEGFLAASVLKGASCWSAAKPIRRCMAAKSPRNNSSRGICHRRQRQSLFYIF